MNITLIASIHSEKGRCNSDELFKILEEIKPDVIFEESTLQFSEMFHSDSFGTFCANSILQNGRSPVVPLEVKAVKKYRQSHDVDIVPVDIDVRQELSKHQDEIFYLFNIIFEHEDYKKLESERDIPLAQEGFHFLNIDIFLDFLEKKKVVERSIMESQIQKDRLFSIYKLFYEINCDKREGEMIRNIYNLSKENPYNQAVLLIGAEHKPSIMQKVTEFKKLSEIKLNWKMYADK